jgi:hypothetical protein
LLLACSKCHELFNHEASQSNYGASVTEAGEKAKTNHAALAENSTIYQLLTGTKHYQNGVIMYLPERQDNCGSGGMLFSGI